MKRNNIVVRCILLGLLVVLRLDVEAQERLVRPAALKVGDTIAIVLPLSTPDSMTVVKGCQTLCEWGFVPVVGSHALSNYHGFAGTADERAADLLWALRDSTIKRRTPGISARDHSQPVPAVVLA